MTPHLFVYGTLMPDAEGSLGGTERNRLRDAGAFLGSAKTPGVLLDLGHYPGLALGTDTVYGGIYKLHEPGKTLRWLDVYEGLTGDPGDEYVRREIPVALENGQNLPAWTYVFIGNSFGLCKITSGRWQPRRR
jgi:gamma-glutamylcyclotransferase (GGCT)/AIG2-like uncharacterized protein YtfP